MFYEKIEFFLPPKGNPSFFIPSYMQTRSENTVLVSISCRLLKGGPKGFPFFRFQPLPFRLLQLHIDHFFGLEKSLREPL